MGLRMNWFKKRKPSNLPESSTLSENDTLNLNGVNKYYCSFVSEDLIFKHGLNSSIIVGEVKKLPNGEYDFESGFSPNSAFKKTIFSFIKTEMNQDRGLVQAAINQKNGYVYVFDQ